MSLLSWSCCCSVLLHETVVWQHYCSTAVIIAGSVLVVLNSNHSEQDFTLTELEGLFKYVNQNG